MKSMFRAFAALALACLFAGPAVAVEPKTGDIGTISTPIILCDTQEAAEKLAQAARRGGDRGLSAALQASAECGGVSGIPFPIELGTVVPLASVRDGATTVDVFAVESWSAGNPSDRTWLLWFSPVAGAGA